MYLGVVCRMAKKKQVISTPIKLLILLGLLIIFGAIVLYYRSHIAQPESNPTSVLSDNKTSPSPDAGNSAKSTLSSPTPGTIPPNNTNTKTSTSESSSMATSNYVEYFMISPRGSGQYVTTTLSTSAAGGKCMISLTPTGATSVAKDGMIISTGSSLACDFGGIIEVQGHGAAQLVVTGADGKTQSKDSSF